MSPTSRSTFQVDTAEGIADLFQERDYQSRYFTGEQGAEYWEDFVAESRELHEKNYSVTRRPEEWLPEDTEEEGNGRVVLNVFDEDEYAAYEEQEAGQASGGVTSASWTKRKRRRRKRRSPPRRRNSPVCATRAFPWTAWGTRPFSAGSPPP